MELLNKIKNIYKQICSHKQSVLFIFVACLFSLTVYYSIKQNQVIQINRTIEQTSYLIKQSLEKEIKHNYKLIDKLAQKWQQDHHSSYNLWLLAAGQLVSLSPGIQAIEWVDDNFIVRWIQPIEGNIPALNKNLSTEKTIKAELEKTRDQNKTTTSSIVYLLDGDTGFLSYTPIFQDKNFKGFMIGVYDIAELLKTALTSDNKIFENFQITLSENNNIFYNSNNLLSKKDLSENYKLNFKINLTDHQWNIQLIPTKHYINNNINFLPEAILLIIFTISLLISLIIYSLVLFNKKTTELNLLIYGLETIAEEIEFDIDLNKCLEGICKILNAEIGFVHLVNTKEKNCLIPSFSHYTKDISKYREFIEKTLNGKLDISTELAEQVLQTGKPICTNKIKSNKFIELLSKQNKILSLTSIPIKNKEKTVMILEFYNKNKIRSDEYFLRILYLLSYELSLAYTKKREKNILSKIAYKDPLTNLQSSKFFITETKRAQYNAINNNHNIAIINIKITNFKQLNNNLGFSAGNEIIKYIANSLKKNTQKHDLIFRFTATKFMIILTNIKSNDKIDRIKNSIDSINNILTTPININGSTVILELNIKVRLIKNHDNINKILSEI